MLQKGLRCLERGNIKKAITLFEQALAVDPAEPRALNFIGIAYFRSGAPSRAVPYFDRAILADPGCPEAYFNRASAFVGLNRLADAESDCRRAIAISAGMAAAHQLLGAIVLAKGRFQEAVLCSQAALALNARFPEAMDTLLVALVKLNRLAEGKSAAEKFIKHVPGHLRTLLALAEINLALGDVDSAIAVLNAALVHHAGSAEAHHLFGLAQFAKKKPVQAIAAADLAIRLNAKLAKPYVTRGAALQQLGQFDDAVACFDQALSLGADSAGVLFDLVRAKRFRDTNDPHLRLIEASIDQEERATWSSPWEALVGKRRRASLFYAAAKAYDDLGQFQRAFAFAARANEIERSALPYDPTVSEALLSSIRNRFTAGFVESRRGGGCQSNLPIFVLGMPRSGTTLVEQLIARAGGVFAGGESGLAAELFRPLLAGSMTSSEDFGRSGKSYVDALARLSPSATRITDKMPTNFVHLGALYLALPNAKIVHTMRDPLDTCLSCFMTPWRHMERFNTDLRTLGRFYRFYRDLMDHWRRVIPADAWLDVQYESLIANTESEVDRIMAYCNLRYDRSIKDGVPTDVRIETASQFQARQPIYSSSIGRSENYRGYLEPLMTELGVLSSDKRA